MQHYLAIFDRAADRSFGVVFPDFPGCTSAGDTYEDAVRNASEALSAHVDLMRKDGDAIPAPRTLDEIRAANEDWFDLSDAIFTLIPLLPPSRRSVRINITVDERLLGQIDAATTNRSGFFSDAARRVLMEP